MAKVKEDVGRIFCKHGLMIVKKDHVARHGCIKYNPTMHVTPKWCGVCSHSSSLTMDEKLTEKQKQMIAEHNKPSVPAFAAGDL